MTTTTSEPYSDLEVAHLDTGLEHFKRPDTYVGNETKNGVYKETSYTPGSYKPYPDANVPLSSSRDTKMETTPRRRICGLASRTFWIILVIAVVIIAAAVGGGIGEALSHKSTKTSSKEASTGTSLPDSGTSSSSSTSQTISSANSHITTGPITSLASKTDAVVAITTTSIIGASTTLLSDCPSSNNTLYTTNNATYRKICGNDYIGSNDVVNQPVSNLDSCINLCAAYNTLNERAIVAGNMQVCNAVCWIAGITNEQFPGQCFGVTTTNSSGEFVYGGGADCDSAAWIDQSF